MSDLQGDKIINWYCIKPLNLVVIFYSHPQEMNAGYFPVNGQFNAQGISFHLYNRYMFSIYSYQQNVPSSHFRAPYIPLGHEEFIHLLFHRK